MSHLNTIQELQQHFHNSHPPTPSLPPPFCSLVHNCKREHLYGFFSRCAYGCEHFCIIDDHYLIHIKSWIYPLILLLDSKTPTTQKLITQFFGDWGQTDLEMQLQVWLYHLHPRKHSIEVIFTLLDNYLHNIKEITYTKTKICWKFTHSQAIQEDISLFIPQNRVGEMQHYIICLQMDHLQWMGAVRKTVHRADKKHHNNPQIITWLQSIS